MSTLANLREPGIIALIFTAGTLINRRQKQCIRHSQDPEHGFSDPRKMCVDSSQRSSWLSDNAVFRYTWPSRILAAFPFLLEIWYWNLTYWVYQLARACSAHLIRKDTRVYELAENHALFILNFERRLGIAIELPVQQFVLSRTPWLMPVLAKIYHSHIIVGACFIVYSYTFMPRDTFTRIRRTIAMDNVIAFVIVTAWRCKPPRLMPEEYGYIDVLHPHLHAYSNHTVSGEPFSLADMSTMPTVSAWNNNPHQLTIAAMPSLHFGTSLFLALCIVRFSPHRTLRTLALLWPLSMLLTILATANHWVLDAVVGATIPYLGWRLNWVLKSQLIIFLEEWGFWLCRIEGPTMLCKGSVEFVGMREEKTDSIL